jgi:outer membrane receptor protein involved in Fe transport
MRFKAALPAVMAMIGGPALAQAQTAIAPSGSDAPTAVTTVVVSAARPLIQEKVDRTVYAVDQDIEAQLGTVAELLRKLPQVDVDLDGNPSIRGDSGVQVLVNGRPAPMLNGLDRGAMLQMLGADNVVSVEIITNPSARFRPDGSGGIINIVTRAPFNPKPMGIARAVYGSEGGYALGLNGSAGSEPLAVNGGINLRGDARKRVASTERAYTDAETGDPVQTVQQNASNALRFSRSARLGADYTPTKADTITLELDWHDRGGAPKSAEHDVTLDPVAGNRDYERLGQGSEYGVDTDVGLNFKHAFSGEDHEVTLDLERSDSLDRDRTGYRDIFAIPMQPDTRDAQASRTDELTWQATLNYKSPLPGEAKLETGYDLRVNDNLYDNLGGAVDTTSGALSLDAALTNRFHLLRQIHALYATYEKPFGRWTVLGGFRVEDTVVEADQLTSAVIARDSYATAYPSLHLQYALTDTQSLKLSYTIRAQRPSPGDLNPYLAYSDVFNVRSGNPDLRPQTTDGLEFSWQDVRKGGSRSATLYWRETYDVLTDVTRYLSPTVLLTTKANLGQISSTGVDLAARGKATDTLSYSFSGYLFYNQVEASNLGFSGLKAGFGDSAKLNLDWRPTKKDQVQLTANYASARLVSQGMQQPNGGVDLGYRRQLTDAVSAVISVDDLFDTRLQQTRFSNPIAQMISIRQPQGRVASIGLTWRLGGPARPGRG